MNQVVQILIGLALLAFVVGAVAALAVQGPVMGLLPVTYWRGAIGFLAFAMVLILQQIRDKP